MLKSNTPQGTKLILSKQNGDALIYSLGGTLTTQIQELDPTLNLLSNAFPNPTQQFVTIPYYEKTSTPFNDNAGTDS